MKETEQQTYIYETQATGHWTRTWTVKANSEEEALAKLNDGLIDDDSVDYTDEFDDAECTAESDFEFWGIAEENKTK
jgi:hypothetical protein